MRLFYCCAFTVTCVCIRVDYYMIMAWTGTEPTERCAWLQLAQPWSRTWVKEACLPCTHGATWQAHLRTFTKVMIVIVRPWHMLRTPSSRPWVGCVEVLGSKQA